MLQGWGFRGRDLIIGTNLRLLWGSRGSAVLVLGGRWFLLRASLGFSVRTWRGWVASSPLSLFCYIRVWHLSLYSRASSWASFSCCVFSVSSEYRSSEAEAATDSSGGGEKETFWLFLGDRIHFSRGFLVTRSRREWWTQEI